MEATKQAIELTRRVGRREQMLSATANLGYNGFLAGKWDEGADAVDAALAEEAPTRDRMMLLNNSLIIRAGRGEDVQDGLAEMSRLATGLSGADVLATVADPTANAAMARGEFKTARDQFIAVAGDDLAQAPEYLYRAAHPTLWLRDLADAKALLGRLEEVGGSGPAPEARLATVRAGIAALEGKPVEAMAQYREALRGWRETNAVWDEVMTGVDMAELLDPADPEVASVLASTRQILERLRAKPYLARLDALANRGQPTDADAAQQLPTQAGVVTASS